MTAPQQSTSPPDAFNGDLFDWLVANDHLAVDLADQARRRQQRQKMTPEQALLDLGSVSQELVFRGVAAVSQLPFFPLHGADIDKAAIDTVPVKVALHYKFIPISLESSLLTAAFSAPPSMRDCENLRLLVGKRLTPVISTPTEISRAITQNYGIGADTVIQLRQDRKLLDDSGTIMFEGQDLDRNEDAEGSSIIRLVNQLLIGALEVSATDIHIEPFESTCSVRYRVDGVLRDIPTPTGLNQLHSAIISRLKIMADLDIAEHRLPHDGRIHCRLENEAFDLRVSILPTRFGETLCMRILDRESIFFDLAQLGLEPDHLKILTDLLYLPFGMILVTGPTGSGKTTTLYAALQKTDKIKRKVITVEDPVEYQLDGISQIQIHSKIGLTFAAGLRSILRHDPDIILVGEIRDPETAEIAIRSAMTGHLVLSTLHTNDSVAAINRLVDMQIEPYLVATTLSAVVAQRLVRRLCPHCKEPDDEIRDAIRREIASVMDCEDEDVKTFRAVGCIECDHIGYRGRVAIYEFFVMHDDFEEKIAAKVSTLELRRAAIQKGMRTLRHDGWLKVERGLTSIDEINRITAATELRM